MRTKNKNNRRKNKLPKMKATWVSKRGHYDNLFQTLGKEKASKRKTPQRIFPKKGLMDKTQRKNGFLKGKTSKKNKIGRKETF